MLSGQYGTVSPSRWWRPLRLCFVKLELFQPLGTSQRLTCSITKFWDREGHWCFGAGLRGSCDLEWFHILSLEKSVGFRDFFFFFASFVWLVWFAFFLQILCGPWYPEVLEVLRKFIPSKAKRKNWATKEEKWGGLYDKEILSVRKLNSQEK